MPLAALSLRRKKGLEGIDARLGARNYLYSTQKEALLPPTSSFTLGHTGGARNLAPMSLRVRTLRVRTQAGEKLALPKLAAHNERALNL